ncbi:hypothetical protein [Actinokineospora iranica]|uniref:hypothetical protein n=1 Tax=Actinokineospora iranica TaxID=1271860 RepID=UPI0011136C87|nr:hypothetical protein [Actinokineospora iranica]
MRLFLALATALSLAAAGCSAERPAQRPPASDDGRSPSAVVAALRPLDACALGATEGLTAVGLGPHRCRFDGQAGQDYLFLVIGAYMDAATRAASPPEEVAIDGARGWRRSLDTGCQMAVPVGADLVIRVSSLRGYKSPRPQSHRCADATAAAGRVVERLGTPAAVSPRPPRRDACDLLDRAAGDHVRGLDLRFDEVNYGLDHCQARRTVPGGWSQEYSVQVRYGRADPRQKGTRQISVEGRAVTVAETSKDCEYGWAAEPSPVARPELSEIMVRLRAPDCARAAELAPRVMRFYVTPPPEVAPQSPIPLPHS